MKVKLFVNKTKAEWKDRSLWDKIRCQPTVKLEHCYETRTKRADVPRCLRACLVPVPFPCIPPT
jgi:hypothetical protein